MLKEIYVRMKDVERIVVGDNCFAKVPQDCVLYVPKGCEEAYRAHPGFRCFENIVSRGC